MRELDGSVCKRWPNTIPVNSAARIQTTARSFFAAQNPAIANGKTSGKEYNRVDWVAKRHIDATFCRMLTPVAWISIGTTVPRYSAYGERNGRPVRSQL